MRSAKNSEIIITKSTKNIIPLALIICVTVIVSVYIVASSLKEAKIIALEYDSKNNIIDKFTYCMQTVMTEHPKVGKFLEAEKAREICKSLER
jgi:amino acid permease